MVRSLIPILLVAVLAASGCLSQKGWQEFLGEEHPTPLVPADAGDSPAPQPVKVHSGPCTPAPGNVSLQVHALGRKLLDANPQTGLQTTFITIISPNPELFHCGTTQVYITDTLVKECTSDAQLAAVLCHELGKMVAEREALASPQMRSPDRRAPPDVPYGNAGQFGAADQVREAEVAKFASRRRAYEKPLPPPDPTALARWYLKKAGYRETDLDVVAPLLQKANATFVLEKHFKNAVQDPPPPVKPALPPPAPGNNAVPGPVWAPAH